MDIDAEEMRIRDEAVQLAGRPQDLVQRASVYHHLYSHSGGNHVFPLLAAHGALWGSLHFARGRTIGQFACLLIQAQSRRSRLAALDELAYAFKDINRRVCVETYAFYHLTAICSDMDLLQTKMPKELAEALLTCHSARRSGRSLGPVARRRLFGSFFLWEQDAIVGPGVDAAVAAFDWPSMKWLALKPPVGFRYFGPLTWLWFREFDSKAERILKGRQAYDLAEAAGLDRVEACLARYRIMPPAFCDAPDRYYSDVRAAVLGDPLVL